MAPDPGEPASPSSAPSPPEAKTDPWEGVVASSLPIWVFCLERGRAGVPGHGGENQARSKGGSRRQHTVKAIHRARGLELRDPAEFERLPGIGPVLARRLEGRRPYRFTEELARVPGIGEKIISQLKPLVKTGVATPD
ncbi:MAG TPA: hypothetical protein DIT13_19280 [Verrucomicrobiales bacterium]|nr:hypothetical protein [Verrucomicrobiales bacterium]